MYAMITIYLSLITPGNMTLSNGHVYPDQASCEQRRAVALAYIQGMYVGHKDWEVFNNMCVKLEPMDAQAN
jgi:hypothetical protein